LTASSSTPRAVRVIASFFALAGVLEIGFGLWEAPPHAFWPAWEALGRGIFHFLLALGLWNRIALCRTIAMVYCLAVLVTYAFVLGLAFAHAPVRFPTSIVVDSLYQVPSCALMLPYLRSEAASGAFTRPLFH
jgi:hypothetical protein